MNAKYLGRKQSKSGHCEKCGAYRERLCRDHIKPRWKGIDEDENNIQCLCANCHEDKTRIDISEALRGRKFSEEHSRKIGDANRGKKRTKEHQENLTKSLKQALASPEVRLKMRDAHLGKPWSEKRRRAWADKK